MFDGAIRCGKVSELYEKIVKGFSFDNLPQSGEEVFGTVGFPSRRARGKPDDRLGAELLRGEWQGHPNEKGILSVHPEKVKDTEEAAWAILYAALRATYRATKARRWYDNFAGDKETRDKIKSIAQEVGEFPAGYADLRYRPRQDHNRMRRYICKHGQIIRAATNTLQATCDVCREPFKLQ